VAAGAATAPARGATGRATWQHKAATWTCCRWLAGAAALPVRRGDQQLGGVARQLGRAAVAAGAATAVLLERQWRAAWQHGGGHLDVLRWLRAQQPPCPWGETTSSWAACARPLGRAAVAAGAATRPAPGAEFTCGAGSRGGHLGRAAVAAVAGAAVPVGNAVRACGGSRARPPSTCCSGCGRSSRSARGTWRPAARLLQRAAEGTSSHGLDSLLGAWRDEPS